MNNNKFLIAKTFYTFMVSGMMVLMIGAVMPFIIEDYQIGYTVAGLFMSLYSVGNLFASFAAVFFIKLFGRRKSAILLSSLVFLPFTGIIFFHNIYLLYVMFFLAGLGRGSISNINNAVINDIAVGKSSLLNLLHTFFAIGAFTAPIIASVVIGYGFSWKVAVTIGILFSVSMVLVYFLMDIDTDSVDIKKNSAKSETKFYKNIDFYIAGLLLFFYLGVENCVNGWVVTYFKDSGIMSTSYAQTLLSLVWIVIILGRLITAFLSEKKFAKELLILFNCIGAAVFFAVLINSRDSSVITASIAGFGFFLAGIYPTTIATTGKILKGSSEAMAVLLAIAGLGGIVMPYVVGVVAESNGIAGGMTVVTVDMFITLIFAFILFFRGRRVAAK